MRDNVTLIHELFPAHDGRVSDITSWTESMLERLAAVLPERRRDGHVRECHGDLHLKNLVRLPSGIVPYDCVEFSVELRNIDASVFFGGDPGSPDTFQKFYADVQMYANTFNGTDPQARAEAEIGVATARQFLAKLDQDAPRIYTGNDEQTP